jgi:hypothetical protein
VNDVLEGREASFSYSDSSRISKALLSSTQDLMWREKPHLKSKNNVIQNPKKKVGSSQKEDESESDQFNTMRDSRPYKRQT